MRHKRREKHFGRKPSARKALIRGLVDSLVEHGRIRTTVEKAKELRRHIEPAVTLGKKGDLATRRVLLSRYPNKSTVKTIVDDISPRFADRQGGYTRVIKIGRRPGDTAEMAFIEFVDFDWEAREQKLQEESSTSRVGKVSAERAAKRRKSYRKMQNESRRQNRAV